MKKMSIHTKLQEMFNLLEENGILTDDIPRKGLTLTIDDVTKHINDLMIEKRDGKIDNLLK